MQLLIHTLAFSALIVGSITDLRKREVPDWLNYGLLASAAALRVLFALTLQSWLPIAEGFSGFIVMVAVALLLFYSGQMGGGDAKLLMAMGMLLGLPLQLSAGVLSPLVAFLFNSLIVGALYGVGWGVMLALRHWRVIHRSIHAAFTHPALRRTRKFGLGISILLLLLGFVSGSQQLLIFCFSLVLFYLVLLYTYVFVKAVEQTCMLKRIPVSQLTVGDWIPEDIVVSGKRIAGPKDLGLSPEQLITLQHLAKKRKITTVLVKEGIPFLPSFLGAYAVTVVWGNLLFLLFAL